MNRSARKFLKTGRVGRSDQAVLAATCGRIVLLESQRSLEKALPLARRFVRNSRPYGHPLLTTALRALGWVQLDRGRYAEAARWYLAARELLLREPLARARVDRTLIDVYMHLGNMPEARRRARLAMGTFRRLKSEVDFAKTRINYANVFHRQDRHREACRQYEKAAKTLRSAGDEQTLAICEYNLANVLVQLFDLKPAEKYYKNAERRFIDQESSPRANECRYGLAWLRMLQGSFHQALLDLAECEKQFAKVGRSTKVLLCQLDRAETYLSLNLFGDARSAARAAERNARRRGMRYEAAKAAFFRAKAAYAMGDTKDAVNALSRARSDFLTEGNTGFVAAVELTATQIKGRNRPDARMLARARRGFSRAQLPLWEAICDLHLMATRPGDKSIDRRLRTNPALKAVPHLYAQWQTLLGDRLMNRGRLAQAREHWTAAADTLDVIRAKLPPVELQSAFMIGRSDPYLRLTHSLEASDAAEAAVWSERHRTSGLWSAPADLEVSDSRRHRAARSLADLAQRVSALSSRIADNSQLRLSGASAGERELAKLQKQVRLDLCALSVEAPRTEYSVQRLRKDFESVSRRQPVVQFHCDGPDLLAFVHEGGQVHCHRYRDGQRNLRRHLGCWQVLLSRALQNRETPAESDIAEEQRLFGRFGDWLWAPLEIPTEAGTVLILPEGRTSNLPWSALRIGGDWLAERHGFVVSPSLRHHLRADKTKESGQKVEIFVGRTDGLSHCRSEIKGLASREDLEVVMHDPCRRTDWPNDSQAGIWHYTGHAALRADNPFYSSLQLQDGPLFAADFRLKRNRVGLVTLAACRTGQQMYLPGEESSGLVRSLLEMGARNVVASHWAISDEPSAIWIREFYLSYMSGTTLPAVMQETARKVREQYRSAYHWAAFSLFGAA